MFFDSAKEESSKQAEWYRGVTTKMTREINQRNLYGKETMDQSANEIFLKQVKGMSAALSRAGHAEAAARKLAIKTAWRAAGRGGESSFISYGGLKWNDLYETTVVEAPQSKTSKLKLVPLVAGADRHSDWLIDFGDNLVLARGSILWKNPDDESKKCWLLPDMVGPGSSSTKLSNYIKALQPEGRAGSLVRYAGVACPWIVDDEPVDLPPQPTAAGIRPGASDTLAMHVPAELAVHTTGHDLTNLSALWEYLHARVALCVPGAVVLAGWPSFPYGQNGKGPVHPSLQPLLRAEVPLKFLEAFADELFSLHDGSPPMLLQGGPCRKMIHATLATLVMYYQDRCKANEASTVLAQMRDSYAKLASKTDDPHTIFVKWGAAIRKRFDLDNLHLTTRQAHGELEQLVGAIHTLSHVMNGVQSQLSDVAVRIISLESRLDSVDRRLSSGAAAQSPNIPVPTPPVAACRPADHASPPPATAATATPAAVDQPQTSAASHDSHSALEVLRGVGDIKHYSTARVLGGQFYLDCMARGGHLVPVDDRRKASCQRVLDAYVAMTSQEERRILTETPRDVNHCNGIVR